MNSTADQSLDRIVPLARVVREHGFERSGVLTFKADLFSRGAPLLKSRDELWFRGEAESAVWRKVKLVAPSSPHGGGWDHAKGLLIRVSKDAKIGRGELIGLRRGDFPALAKGYYICDLLGQTVVDEGGVAVAVVTGFQDLAPGTNVSAVNLMAKTMDGRLEFSFPSQWVTPGAEKATLRVEGIHEWILSGREASDEARERPSDDGRDDD